MNKKLRTLLTNPFIRHVLSVVVSVGLTLTLSKAGMNDADAHGVGAAIGNAVQTAPL